MRHSFGVSCGSKPPGTAHSRQRVCSRLAFPILPSRKIKAAEYVSGCLWAHEGPGTSQFQRTELGSCCQRHSPGSRWSPASGKNLPRVRSWRQCNRVGILDSQCSEVRDPGTSWFRGRVERDKNAIVLLRRRVFPSRISTACPCPKFHQNCGIPGFAPPSHWIRAWYANLGARPACCNCRDMRD